MSLVGIYTDVHASVHSSIMTMPSSGKYSMRLNMIVESFKWMYELFERHGVDMIVNLGDLFDSHVVRSEEITAISEAYTYSRGVPEIHIIGNHDTLDVSRKFYSTSLLNNVPFIDVYSEPCKIDDTFSVIPYMKSESVTPEMLKDLSNKVLLSHLDIKGSHLRPDYVMDSGVDSELLAMNFDVSLNGHLHTAETIHTTEHMVINVGSFSSNSFSDSNTYIPGVCILDTDTYQLVRYNNPHAILFRRMVASSLDDLMKKLCKLDSGYRYILRVTVPYHIKDDVAELLSQIEEIVIYRVVADIHSSHMTEKKVVNSSTEKSIEQEFLEFLKKNPELAKYPISEYSEMLK